MLTPITILFIVAGCGSDTTLASAQFQGLSEHEVRLIVSELRLGPRGIDCAVNEVQTNVSPGELWTSWRSGEEGGFPSIILDAAKACIEKFPTLPVEDHSVTDEEMNCILEASGIRNDSSPGDEIGFEAAEEKCVDNER